MKVLRSFSILILFSVLSFGAIRNPEIPEEASPNFIFILLDDFGWTFPSFPMDSRLPEAKSDYFETPNLERLAEMGMRFTNAYAPAAICSPTRRSIQFGQTPARQGEEKFAEKYETSKDELISIPRILKRANPEYQTAHYGKWDLRADIFPEDIGYDESDGNTGNRNGNVFRHKSEKWTEAFINSDPKRIESLTARSLNFIERQVKSDKPFYLQLSHYATHVDMQTKEESFARFEKKGKGEMHNIPQFAGMVADVDEAIGRILDKIEALGIANNTYIFLMTDNGGVPFIAPNREKLIHPDKYTKVCRNAPLRGGKWTLYEGGVRVPFLAAGPGVKAGIQCDTPIVGWDLLSTLADFVGAKKLPKDVDGGSFRSLLAKGNSGEINRPQNMLVFHRFHKSYGHSAIRRGSYKLIRFWKDDKMELYDLSMDLGEKNNLAEAMPEKVGELNKALMDYLREVEAEVLVEDD